MRRFLLVIAALAAAAPLAHAQTAGKPAAAPAPAPAPSAAKKELIAKVIQAQQAGIDRMARQMVEQPVVMLLQRAGPIIQNRVPPDQREAVARDIQADVRKFVDETTPIVRQKAKALAPTTLGPLLDQKLTEAELKEVAAILESNAWRKFQGLAPEMEKALGEKLVAETKAQVEPKLKALEQSMSKRVGLDAPPAAPASAAAGGK
jgi:hypothetical protein